jgi:hypothetical protein
MLLYDMIRESGAKHHHTNKKNNICDEEKITDVTVFSK